MKINKIIKTGKRTLPQYIYKRSVVSARLTNRKMQLTKDFYVKNAKKGWKNGHEIAKSKQAGQLGTLYHKFRGAVKNTKVRRDDLPFLIAAPTVPFPLPTLAIFGVTKGLVEISKKIKLPKIKLPKFFKK